MVRSPLSYMPSGTPGVLLSPHYYALTSVLTPVALFAAIAVCFCVCVGSSQEIESQLDAWSYQQRLRDATTHSQSVTREYPVALVKASVSQSDGRVHFHPYKRSLKDKSRESFLRKLQQVDANEYGPLPSKPNKKQKHNSNKKQEATAQLQIDWSQEDPLESFRKHTSSISQLLSKTLDKRIGSGRKAAVAAMGSRVVPSPKRNVRSVCMAFVCGILLRCSLRRFVMDVGWSKRLCPAPARRRRT